jgi:hypothetical protein
MVLRNILAKVLVFAILQFGALAGVPMDPQHIQKLMNVIHRTKIEHVVKKNDPRRRKGHRA